MRKLLQIWFITISYSLLKLIFTIFAVAMKNVFLATQYKNGFVRSYISKKHLCWCQNRRGFLYKKWTNRAISRYSQLMRKFLGKTEIFHLMENQIVKRFCLPPVQVGFKVLLLWFVSPCRSLFPHENSSSEGDVEENHVAGICSHRDINVSA